MSIFSETMKTAISIYRGMLRKHLPQDIRLSKLNALNLKNPELYENEVALYHTGHSIVLDIERNIDRSVGGYYSYSGVKHFADHLKTFLNHYELEGDCVIHRSQRASRALLKAIQLLTLPREQLVTPDVVKELTQCNEIIARYGSDEQKDSHKSTLQKTIRHQQEQNTSFYRSVLTHFQDRLQDPGAAE
ncbi:MAG: hypothetical protein A3F41_05660 [Coxiella sp. RIFCSPHIGHO2_12_FULL_44_14]|nr:MAG: hypothetical protein A3F41_05660 [Coxiella sp. RIFCSPHIGHO2_12_FULL_44_14]